MRATEFDGDHRRRGDYDDNDSDIYIKLILNYDTPDTLLLKSGYFEVNLTLNSFALGEGSRYYVNPID